VSNTNTDFSLKKGSAHFHTLLFLPSTVTYLLLRQHPARHTMTLLDDGTTGGGAGDNERCGRYVVVDLGEELGGLDEVLPSAADK
jgi:hypothetical protein